MFATTRRFWNRLIRRRKPVTKLARRRLPLSMERLELRDVPATLYALTEAPNQQLLIFNSAAPGAPVALNITGLDVGESLVGIDFRPLNEQLYGVSNVNSKLYLLNQNTGAASLVGSFVVAPVATNFGLDFNPVVDKLRYVADSGANLRINPDTGTLFKNDPGINGATTGLDGVAYTNNFNGATKTQLFGINSASDQLFEVTDPNTGATVLIGNLGVDTDGRLGFDIASDDGVAYAALTVAGVAKLFSIDLGTGTATDLGQIGKGAALVGLSAQPTLNANPVIAFSGIPQTFDIGAGKPIAIDPNGTIVDPDNAIFLGGKLTVSSAASVAGDVVSILNIGTGAGQVSVSGNNVFYEGALIGMFTSGDGFTVPLTVDFNASATLAAVQAVFRAASFFTTDNTLPNSRTFSAMITDGDGGSGATANTQTVVFDDLTAPTVVSITRDQSSPTNATSVSYTVTFSEDVTGVMATDFKTVISNLVSATVTGVTQLTPSTYMVTVDVGALAAAGDGTVRLDLIDNDSIFDTAGNPLGGAGDNNGDFMGEVYTIDRTAPICIIALAPGQDNPAQSQPVVFFVSFSEGATGFDLADIDLSQSTVTGALVANIILMSPGNYNVEISGATSNGDIVLNVAKGAAVDAAGNPSDTPIIFDNTVTLEIENKAPVITAPATVATDEDTEFEFTGADAVSIADDDIGTGMMEVTLTATNGQIRLGSTTGLTFSVGDGSLATTMTFQGTLADINAALATLFFDPTANFTGAATVVIDANDLGNTGIGGPQTTSATIDVTVNEVNDGPTITFANTPYATDEDTTFTFPAGSIVIADIDADPDEVQVTLKVSNGTLTLGTLTGLTFTAGDGTDDATMTFTGTLAAINAALDTLSFDPADNFNGDATLDVEVDDLGNNGTGGSLTATDSETITVNAINDGPTINAPATVTTAEDTQLIFSGANLISITDVDAGTGTIKVTLEVTNGTLTLSGITGLTFTTGDGTSDAKMEFTGTLADINTALNGLKYNPTANFNGSDTLAINVDDQGNSGTGGSKTASQEVAITVTAGADTPVAVNDSFTTAQRTPLVIPAPGILGNDTSPDGSPLSAILVTNVPAEAGTLTFTGGNGTGNGGFTFTPAPNFSGTVTFTYRASNGTQQSNIATVTITVTENLTRLHATGAGAGGGPHVIVRNNDGSIRFSFYAFDPAFSGGVSVATGDVNGDGVEDIIVGAGPGGGPHVQVLSGVNLARIHSFYALDPSFTGGVNVAAGDVNGDGFSDVIIGAGAGAGPHVRVISGKNGAVLHDFFAYDPLFAGGVTVASADYNGDGRSDIVTGAGAGGGPHVIVYDGVNRQILQSFYAFDQQFPGGVNVAAGEFNGEGAIFAGAGPGTPPVVSIFDFKTATEKASFFAFDEEQETGVRVGTEVLSNGQTILFVGAGFSSTPLFRSFDAETLAEINGFDAYDPSFLGGVFVG